MMLQDVKNMVSPFTGGQVTLNWEWRDMQFRKENIRVMFPFYRCEDTKEQFTTTESDGIWMTQMRNQYCYKHGIPFTDEIIAVRERYGVSALKMSLILGFGENQWRKYEQEEVPSLSNGKMILSIMNPKVFLDLVNSSRNVLNDKEYDKIVAKVISVIQDSDKYHIESYETKRIYTCGRSEANGFAPLSLKRLKNIILYLLNECGETFYTKMNKLLFYVDFLSYRERGMAMTGLCYQAIDYGPVPENWGRVYSQFDEVEQSTRVMTNYEGNVILASTQPDMSLFSKEELEIMQTVCNRFKSSSSREISAISHEEKGWLDCHINHSRIPFAEAFELKAV